MVSTVEAAQFINELERIKEKVSSDRLIDITPEKSELAQEYQIFKDVKTYVSYLYTRNKIYPIAQIHCGFGIINVADLHKSGKDYLFYSVTSGSGILGTIIVNFDFELYKETFLHPYSSYDFSALALLKSDVSIEIYKFNINKMDWKLPFDSQRLDKSLYAKLIVEHDIQVHKIV